MRGCYLYITLVNYILHVSTEDNTTKILKLFFDGPNVRLHIREVARRTGLSPFGAMKILESLEKEGMLVKEPTPIVVEYHGNYTNEKFLALKRSLNLYGLYTSGLVSALIDFYNVPECICIFGSYAKGEDIKESDIDLAIVTSIKKLPDLGAYEEKLKRKISVHLVKDVKKEDAGFINSLANGIVLYGYLEVV